MEQEHHIYPPICLHSRKSFSRLQHSDHFSVGPGVGISKTSYFVTIIIYDDRISLLITTVLFKIQKFKFQTAKRPPEVRVPDLPENFLATLESK